MLRKLLAKLSGNAPAQALMNYMVFVCQYFQGIGSGSSVGDSGEVAVFEHLLSVSSEPCIFDVGANKGQFLQLALQALKGRRAEVHCFEPSRTAFSLLNKITFSEINVHLNHCALGREEGGARLFYDEDASGLASMSKRNLDHIGIEFGQSEHIRVQTLDAYCRKNGVEHIHLLKIDVEGHELDVLAGAETMLERKIVDMVLFEFGGANLDTRTFFRDFFLLFQCLDMDMFRITPSGFFVPIPAYNEQYEQFRTTNFLCVRRDLQ